jgi:hypothetical protein
MTPREYGYTRIAFYANNYVNRDEFKKKEFTTSSIMSLPADGWNSGSDLRVEIPAQHYVKLITSQDAWDIYRLGGVEADKIIGLWIKPAEIISYDNFESNYFRGGCTRTDLYKDGKVFIGISPDAGIWGRVYASVDGDICNGVIFVEELFSPEEEDEDGNAYHPIFSEGDFVAGGYSLQSPYTPPLRTLRFSNTPVPRGAYNIRYVDVFQLDSRTARVEWEIKESYNCQVIDSGEEIITLTGDFSHENLLPLVWKDSDGEYIYPKKSVLSVVAS